MNYPKDFDRHLIKRIEVEKKFADYIYKEFRSQRYGLASSCSLGQMDKYKIKKELCDWNDLKLKTYSSTTYAERSFYPIPENNPDLFDEITTTTTTTTPIVTTTTTETVQGDPIWVVDTCSNACVYPPLFKPTNTQLENINTASVGGIDILGMGTGRNSILKFSQLDLETIPNNSGNAEITIYCKIDFLSYINELTNDDLFQSLFVDYAEQYWVGSDEIADVNLAIQDWYLTGYASDFFDSLPMPPLSAYNEYNTTGSSFFWIPMAQATLVSATNIYGDPSVKLAFRYIDPTLVADNYGNNAYSMIDIDGNDYYTGDVDNFAAMTLFGNEVPFSVVNNTSNQWYGMNGGLYYETQQNLGNQGFMRAVVKDGYDVYQTDFIQPNGLILQTGMPNPAIYYVDTPEVGGEYLNSDWVLNNPGIDAVYDASIFFSPFQATDFAQPTCSFKWGTGTVTTGENIGLNGNIIEEGILDNECTYIGIETFEEVITTTTTGGETITETVTTFECVNDNEYIVFKVHNQLGDPVEGYDIIIDGGNIGKTSKSGIFKTIIENASVKTKHTLNICHCFYTTGACTQKEIKIIVNDDDIENIVIDKIDCTPISPSE